MKLGDKVYTIENNRFDSGIFHKKGRMYQGCTLWSVRLADELIVIYYDNDNNNLQF